MRDDPAAPDVRFELYPDRSLRREGLRGRMVARFDKATLHIEGDKAGALVIPAGLVARIRFGQVPTRSSGPLHRALVWRKGHEKPLFLTALDRRLPGYGAIMRAFAGQIAAGAGGLARVERGPSPYQAWLAYPLVLLAMAGMAVGAAWEALRGGTSWYWAFAAAMAFITAWLFRVARSDWPRPIRDLAELDAVLPPR